MRSRTRFGRSRLPGRHAEALHRSQKHTTHRHEPRRSDREARGSGLRFARIATARAALGETLADRPMRAFDAERPAHCFDSEAAVRWTPSNFPQHRIGVACRVWVEFADEVDKGVLQFDEPVVGPLATSAISCSSRVTSAGSPGPYARGTSRSRCTAPDPRRARSSARRWRVVRHDRSGMDARGRGCRTGRPRRFGAGSRRRLWSVRSRRN